MNVALHLVKTAHRMEAKARELFKPYGITPAHFNVLNLLAASPGGMKASELACQLVVDRSNITGLIKRMKVEGLVKTLSNLHDRRQHIVGLTSKGQKQWKLACAGYRARMDAVDRGIPKHTQISFRQTLEQLLKIIDQRR
jgi:MarR family transcriptional regulator, lower aerobic nicotinate degradation pathway regulator